MRAWWYCAAAGCGACARPSDKPKLLGAACDCAPKPAPNLPAGALVPKSPPAAVLDEKAGADWPAPGCGVPKSDDAAADCDVPNSDVAAADCGAPNIEGAGVGCVPKAGAEDCAAPNREADEAPNAGVDDPNSDSD